MATKHDCAACSYSTYDDRSMLIHLESKAHDAKCAEWEELDWKVCWICGVHGTDDVMDQHLEGRKHRQREQLCFSCKTCGISTTCTKNTLMHLNGAKHKAAMAAKQPAAKLAPEASKPSAATVVLPVPQPATAVAGPSVKSTAGKPAVYNPIEAASRKAAPLSMAAIQAALEEVCASAVTDVSELLCCPITHEVMQDPVMAVDGYTYERSAIEAVMRAVKPPEYPCSPLTGVLMSSTRLLPNRLALDIIHHLGLHTASSAAAAPASMK